MHGLEVMFYIYLYEQMSAITQSKGVPVQFLVKLSVTDFS